MIREITEKSMRMTITEQVLTNLPEWFGIPSATKEYIEESGKLPMWAAFHEERAVGFLSLLQHNEYSAELYVMGILKPYQHMGYGKALFESVMSWCRENHIEYLQVKTLDSSSSDPNYAKTRGFYRKMGFRPLECFKTLWDEWNPCLVMVMKVTE